MKKLTKIQYYMAGGKICKVLDSLGLFMIEATFAIFCLRYLAYLFGKVDGSRDEEKEESENTLDEVSEDWGN